jgi:anti-anti-sigma factor
VTSQQILGIEQREHEGAHRLVLTGDLDLSSTHQLEAAVAEACGHGAREVEIDLRALGFIDSTGLRGLIVAKGVCHEKGVDLFLVGAEGGHQRRLFELTGLLDQFPWRSADIRSVA